MGGRIARLVVVTRKTPLQLLIERHGTQAQARFYLKTRGQDIAAQEALHARLEAGLSAVMAALPSDQRVVRVDRDELDRFLFSPDDVVAIVGQDGLVPNVAKYLEGQLTLGINPDPGSYDGVLCKFAPAQTPALLAFAAEQTAGAKLGVRRLAMAEARREDGQILRSLNEVFVGHRTHQSARYTISVQGHTERHSSSGLICATGTGATGWARSIAQQRAIAEAMPGPDEPKLAWFVREPFPSVATGVSLNFGLLGPGEELVLTSAMGEGGTLFADGVESDRIEFLDGQTVRISLAERRLNLVVPAP